jgi:hypothetical protein
LISNAWKSQPRYFSLRWKTRNTIYVPVPTQERGMVNTWNLLLFSVRCGIDSGAGVLYLLPLRFEMR